MAPHFGKVYLGLDTNRQRLAEVAIGVIDVRDGLSSAHVRTLAKWITKEEISVLTGWFGGTQAQPAVADFPKLAGAISTGPLCLAFQETDGLKRGPLFMPN